MPRCIATLCLLIISIFGAFHPCAAQTVSVFDVVAVTGTLTVVGTTTLRGNAFSVGTSTLVVNQGKVTIGGTGTTDPATILDVLGAAQFGGGAAKSTFTANGNLSVTYGITAGSVTATHYGDGSNLTGGLVNIKQFGAKGDGTTDDTAAIKTAIASATALYWPAGGYIITSSIVVRSKRGLHWVGEGSETYLINKAPANNPSIAIIDSSHFQIEGISIFGVTGFPNDGMYLAGQDAGTGFGYIRNMWNLANGVGWKLEKLNSVVFEGVAYWPSGQMNYTPTCCDAGVRKYALFVDSTVANNYVNEVGILNSILSLPDSGTANAAQIYLALPSAQTNPLQNIVIFNNDLEGGAPSSQAINISTGAGIVIRENFLENSDITLTNCLECLVEGNYHPHTVKFDSSGGGCRNNVYKNQTAAAASDSLIIGTGCVNNGAENSFIENITDNGSGSWFRNVLTAQYGSSSINILPAGVGIGSTLNNLPPSSVALDVNGAAQFGSGATKSTFTATGGLDVPRSFSVGGSTFVCVAGNCGIGTQSPLARLHVAGNASVTGPSTFGSSATFRAASGAQEQALFVTPDYVAGSTGSSLLIQAGAASGNTYMNLNAYQNGGTAYGVLRLQDGGGQVVVGNTATFESSVTIKNDALWVAGSTITIAEATSVSGATITISNSVRTRGLWSVVASSSPSGGTPLIGFSGLRSSATYRLELSVWHKTAAGHYYLRFNGDGGSNYKGAKMMVQSVNASINGQSGPDDACQLTFLTDSQTTSDGASWTVTFRTAPGDSKRVFAYFDGVYSQSSSNWDRIDGLCRYQGSSELSQVTLYVNAGQFIGDIRLLELVN